MVRLRIPYIPGLPSLPIFVADDRKIFQKHGLEPELTNVQADTGGAVNDVAEGKADLTFPAFFFVLEKAIQSPGSLLVLQHNIDTNVAPTFYGLTAGNKSGIKTVADIAGKKVGVFAAKVPAARQHLFEAYAHSVAEKVDAIPMEPTSPEVPPGIVELAKGKVDALLTAQPIAIFAQLQGAGKQISETPVAGPFPTVIPTSAAITTAKTAEEDPAYARAIAEALDEAVDIIRKEPDSMGEMYIKYQAMPPESEALGNHLVLQFWKSTEIGESEIQISQVYADYLTENGVITGPIDVDSLYPSDDSVECSRPRLTVPDWVWNMRVPPWLARSSSDDAKPTPPALQAPKPPAPQAPKPPAPQAPKPPAPQAPKPADFDLGFSNASFAGFYEFTIKVGPQDTVGFGTVESDGKGNFGGTQKLNIGIGQPLLEQTAQGTYVVNPDGTGTAHITLTQPDGTELPATFDYVVLQAKKRGGVKFATQLQGVSREPAINPQTGKPFDPPQLGTTLFTSVSGR